MNDKLSQKQWGWSESLDDSMTCEVHRIDVVRGGHCSWHLHRERSNVFIAVRGRLVIEWHDEHGDVVQRVLQPGEAYTVPAKVIHRFLAPFESVMAFEVYYATPGGLGPYLVHDDIVRFADGGIRVDALPER